MMQSERIAQLLEDIRLLDEERYALVQSLRKMILSLDPGISEEVKYGGFLYSVETDFCGIFSYTHHISIEFSEGASLSDQHRVLEGKGKFRRHIKIRTADDVSARHLREYVVSALEAASGKTPEVSP